MGLSKSIPAAVEASRDSTSKLDRLRVQNWLDCALSVMHEQCEDDDDRKRDADQPEKSAFAETHVILLR